MTTTAHCPCLLASIDEPQCPLSHRPPSLVHYPQRTSHTLLLARLVHTRAFRAAHDRDDTLYGFMISSVGMPTTNLLRSISTSPHTSIYHPPSPSSHVCLALSCFSVWFQLLVLVVASSFEGRTTESVLLFGENEIWVLRYSMRSQLISRMSEAIGSAPSAPSRSHLNSHLNSNST